MGNLREYVANKVGGTGELQWPKELGRAHPTTQLNVGDILVWHMWN